MDHPSFFHSFCSTRGGDGSPLADEPSFLFGFVDNVFALPGEPGVSPNGGTPQSNKPVPSSMVDICRNSPHTNGNKLQPGAK